MFVSTFLKGLKAAGLFVFVIAMSLGPSGASADQVSVFAAASLKSVMDDVSAAFDAATGHKAIVSLAGSSALARQIEQGAPADVFISANLAWMDYLETKGRLRPHSRVDLLGNQLVLIAPENGGQVVELDSNLDLEAVLGKRVLAMALTEAIPAGIYGKAALTHMGLWETARPYVAQMDNVRAALALVALGEAALGIVYATDAVVEPRVKVMGVFAQNTHPPIIYPAAIMRRSETPLAAEFLYFLQAAKAREIFERHGFEVLENTQ